MNRSATVFLAVFFACSLYAHAEVHAGERARAVLLPVSGPMTPGEKAQLAGEMTRLLGKKYKVIHGKKVVAFLEKTLREENQKDDCDLEACYSKVARNFNAEIVAALVVSKKQGSDYHAVFNITNVLEGKNIYGKSGDCPACSIGKLLELCGTLAPPAE